LRTSISSILFMRANERTTPPRAGTAPPHRPVPAPRATTGSPHDFAILTTAATSRVLRGKTTAAGGAVCEYASNAYTAKSSGAVFTPSAPTASTSRLCNELLIKQILRAQLHKRGDSPVPLALDGLRTPSFL